MKFVIQEKRGNQFVWADRQECETMKAALKELKSWKREFRSYSYRVVTVGGE